MSETAETGMVARRAFRWQGKNLAAGDTFDPSVMGDLKLDRLARQGYIGNAGDDVGRMPLPRPRWHVRRYGLFGWLVWR